MCANGHGHRCDHVTARCLFGFESVDRNVNGSRDRPFGVGDLQGECAGLAGTADDDHQLAVEQFHRGLPKGFQTRGVAVADGLEGACARDLEGQLVGGIGDEDALGIGQRDGDEGKVIAGGRELGGLSFER